MDPRSGFCPATRTFRSLRPPNPLPPENMPLSFPSFALSRLPSPLPAHPAFLDASTGAALSFPMLLSRISSLATALRTSVGIGKGDVVFVLVPASLNVPVIYLASMSMGAVVSPVNPLSTTSEVARAVSLCKPSIIFATADTARKIPTEGRPTIVLLDSARFTSFLHNHEQRQEPPEEVWQSDVAAINYSSGTTGRTKAVAQTHRRLIASAFQVHAARPRTPDDGPVVTLLGVPMFNSYGFNMLLRGVMMAETTVVVTTTRGGAAGVLAAAAKWRATQMFVAPPVVVAMARGGVDPNELPDLIRIICGGAPLSTASASAFHERFPNIDLSLQFGSTEGGVISNMVGPKEYPRVKSTGRLCSGVTAKVVDIISGESLPTKGQGELRIQSPSVMKGYIGGDETNIHVFDSDGWLKTGDLCYIDDDGFLYVVERLKELIKYKAYQVAPAELEDVLHLIPGVLDAAVVPYPDQEAGELPMAFVVKQKESNLSEDQIMEFVGKQVAPHKKIRKVVFLESIPRLASGKLLRRELRNLVSMLPKVSSRL